MRDATLTCMAAAVTVALLATVALAEQGARDHEKIIDVEALTKAMKEATAPVSDRIKSSNLKQKFAEVTALLQAEGIDKQDLLESLAALQGEIDTFVKDWESVAKPLWDGQDSLGETINKVRGMLAGKGGKGNAKTRALLVNYDKRLGELAKAVQAEKDPVRRKRLTRIFANVLGLRKLTERLGTVNLAPATEVLQVRIIQALGALQEQLTQATFEVEKIRVVLASQSEFLGNYIGVLKGAVEAEKLARMLNQMKAEGTDFAGISIDLDGLMAMAEEFNRGMDGFAAKLTDSIEKETAKAAERLEANADFDTVQIEAEIIKYASSKVVKRMIVVE